MGAKYSKLNDLDLIDKVSDDLASSKAIGWFQGRMEFGPKLSSRSILGDPRSSETQKNLNLKVKYRKALDHSLPQF